MRLVFDLDGTLCTTNGSDYENSRPRQQRIDYVNRLYDLGHEIYIDSARGSRSGKNWNVFTYNQLTEWGLKFHKVRCGTKYDADIFIDNQGQFADAWFETQFRLQEAIDGIS